MANPARKPRVFVDANILFSAAAFPRWSYEVIQHAVAGDFQLTLSSLVIKQARRNLQKRFPRRIKQFDELLELTGYEPIQDPSPDDIELNRDLVRDFSDVAVALAVLAAKVDYFVSEDKDFTAKDKTTEKFKELVDVKLAGTFLREVMGWTSEELEGIRYRQWSDIAGLVEEPE
ncbi:MAG: PIN domain-containing protein [Candidatus Micrarchaeota archaeon]